jgi:hypothetical protein
VLGVEMPDASSNDETVSPAGACTPVTRWREANSPWARNGRWRTSLSVPLELRYALLH